MEDEMWFLGETWFFFWQPKILDYNSFIKKFLSVFYFMMNWNSTASCLIWIPLKKLQMRWITYVSGRCIIQKWRFVFEKLQAPKSTVWFHDSKIKFSNSKMREDEITRNKLQILKRKKKNFWMIKMKFRAFSSITEVL